MNVNDYLTQMLRLIFVYLFIYLWNVILPGIYFFSLRIYSGELNVCWLDNKI